LRRSAKCVHRKRSQRTPEPRQYPSEFPLNNCGRGGAQWPRRIAPNLLRAGSAVSTAIADRRKTALIRPCDGPDPRLNASPLVDDAHPQGYRRQVSKSGYRRCCAGPPRRWPKIHRKKHGERRQPALGGSHRASGAAVFKGRRGGERSNKIRSPAGPSGRVRLQSSESTTRPPRSVRRLR